MKSGHEPKASPRNPGIGLRMVPKPGPDDRLLQVVRVISEDGRREVATRDSREASKAGEHSAAVDRYLEGEASPYAQFQGQVRRRCRWGNNTPGGRGGVGGFCSEKGEVSSSLHLVLVFTLAYALEALQYSSSLRGRAHARSRCDHFRAAALQTCMPSRDVADGICRRPELECASRRRGCVGGPRLS